LRAELAKRPTKPWLERLAREAGMKTFLEDGIKKIRQGITTVEEVAKACCITCPGCEQTIAETEEVCPFCQYRLHETCEQCGAKLDIEWLVCPFCKTQKPTA
jgi:type IV pilus assembly protein PilB